MTNEINSLEKQEFQKDPNYIPQDCDLIYTIDPDNPKKLNSVIAMVVRKATREDKIKYILRQQPQLPAGYEFEKKTLRDWFKGDQYLCIEGEDIVFIAPEFIMGLAHRNGSSATTEP